MKKKTLKQILIGAAVVLAVLIAVVAKQPEEFNITRSITISAPAGKIFVQVNNLKNWNSWSPWAKLDPEQKIDFEGPRAGKGAKMSWDGNMDVGKGSMTITESRPNNRIKFQLDFEKPLAGTSEAEFKFKEKGRNTEVTWSITGKKNFIAKAIGLVMNCDKMVGEQFEQGLNNLKGISEK